MSKNIKMEPDIKKLKMDLAVKICGMKEAVNIQEVAALQPDYLGFIFAPNSPRCFEGALLKLPETVKKVGVFVQDSVENIVNIVKQHKLDLVQLHGNETVRFCQELKSELGDKIQIIKVFSVGIDFDFEVLKAFEDHCDFFLLDTKGRFPGGNGTQFDWQILEKYPSKKPFFLSGGIGVDDVAEIMELQKKNLPLHAIDCNSKLEISAGIKNKEQCEKLIKSFAVKKHQ